MHFTVRQEGYPDTKFVLNQPGMHNVLNACSAIAIAREIGIDDKATARACSSSAASAAASRATARSGCRTAAASPWSTTTATTRSRPR
jgi:UDP-N-acetylmuramate-alanine ligase